MSADGRNPGPSWGYRFLKWADRYVPGPVFRAGFELGTAISVPLLPARARASREYLTVLRGRPPRWGEVIRHFLEFSRFLLLRFRVAEGAKHTCTVDPEHGEAFLAHVRTDEPTLFGTFHVGHSDLLGFWLADFKRHLRMVRLRVDNSDDVAWLHRRFAPYIEFLWVNDPEEVFGQIREAVAAGASLALKCDRLGHSARTEAFEFLGCTRQFPFTIYHLAHILEMPVALAVGFPDGPERTRIVALPIYRPVREARRNRWSAARAHFQLALTMVERELHRNPYAWFNFEALNPEATPS